jgi:hypothetical protein
MNWKDLPLNRSKLYLKGTLYGNCEVFVPVKEDATLNDVDKARKELASFIDWQKYELQGGKDTA